jgi:hypothetical protein
MSERVRVGTRRIDADDLAVLERSTVQTDFQYMPLDLPRASQWSQCRGEMKPE